MAEALEAAGLIRRFIRRLCRWGRGPPASPGFLTTVFLRAGALRAAGPLAPARFALRPWPYRGRLSVVRGSALRQLDNSIPTVVGDPIGGREEGLSQNPGPARRAVRCSRALSHRTCPLFTCSREADMGSQRCIPVVHDRCDPSASREHVNRGREFNGPHNSTDHARTYGSG